MILMDSGHSLDIKVSNKTSKTQIQLCIVGIDEQLNELYNELMSYPSSLIFRVTKIRNEFFRLSNYVEGLNVVKFASHEEGDKTPLNAECCC